MTPAAQTSLRLSLASLLEYTDWERGLWQDFFRKHDSQVLEISAGPNGDGRFQTIGDLVKHVFSAEKRYVERLLSQPLTDASSIPSGDIGVLFQFGQKSRAEFKELLETFPPQDWDSPREFKILDFRVTATPKKIAVHVLTHEIRHWAQIATLVRLNGFVPEFHDFLGSPVFGGEFGKG